MNDFKEGLKKIKKEGEAIQEDTRLILDEKEAKEKKLVDEELIQITVLNPADATKIFEPTEIRSWMNFIGMLYPRGFAIVQMKRLQVKVNSEEMKKNENIK